MAAGPDKPSLKPLEWISSSRADLTAFPAAVRKEMGHSLHLAQAGEKPPNAKPLRGFGGAGVLEVVESYQGNAYRAVYTVKFTQAVYVLHAFQKKSKRGSPRRKKKSTRSSSDSELRRNTTRTATKGRMSDEEGSRSSQ